MQQGQVFELRKRAVDGSPVWAYRYRTGSPGSRRLQRGGFCSERDAAEALERALEHLRRQKGVGSTLTFRELVEEYLAQHDAEPETIEKLSWLLAKALRAFGGRRLPELRSQEIAAWRMTISPGHRFEATQALRAAAGTGSRVGNDRLEPRQARSRQPAASAHREATVRVMGATRRARWAARAAPRAGSAFRGRDRIAARRVDGARAARHRPPSKSRLRPSRTQKRPAQEHEDRGEHPRGAAAGRRAGCARPDQSRAGESASLPVAPRRLLRPPQLPQPLLETRPDRGGHRAAAPRLRSPPHVRNLRAPRRHLNLRPLALHGSQPDDDRPPLRPPRARRTRARNPAP